MKAPAQTALARPALWRQTRHCPQRQAAAVGKFPCTTIQQRARAQGNISSASSRGRMLPLLFSQVLFRTHARSWRLTHSSGAPQPCPEALHTQRRAGGFRHGASRPWHLWPGSTLELTGAVTGLAGRERDSSEPRWSGEGQGVRLGAWGRPHREGNSDMRGTLCGSLPGPLTSEPPLLGPSSTASESVQRSKSNCWGSEHPSLVPWGSMVQDFFFYWPVPVTGPSSGSPGHRTHPIYSLRMAWNQPASRSTVRGSFLPLIGCCVLAKSLHPSGSIL